jgi:hypothetical protein
MRKLRLAVSRLGRSPRKAPTALQGAEMSRPFGTPGSWSRRRRTTLSPPTALPPSRPTLTLTADLKAHETAATRVGGKALVKVFELNPGDEVWRRHPVHALCPDTKTGALLSPYSRGASPPVTAARVHKDNATRAFCD